MKDSYTIEIDRLRSEMHKRRILETSVEHLKHRKQPGKH